MDSQDIRTLQLLEEVGNAEIPSQRELAGKLGVSLGLVNSFVQRLAKKGYLKIRTIPRNRVKYILTSKGAAEKTRLTYEYIQYSYYFYKGARQKLRRIFEKLTELGVRRVVFYGATDLAEIAFISLQETSIELMVVVDDLRIGKDFLGGVVADPVELDSFSFDRIIITADNESTEDILERISAKGISRSNVVTLQ